MQKMNLRASSALAGMLALSTAGGGGLMMARAEAQPSAAEINDALNKLHKTFEEFKAANEQKIAELKKGQDDVVTTEKLDKVNDEVGKLQKTVDEMSMALAAQQLGAGAGGGLTAEEKAYSQAFNKFFRRGVEDGLQDLAVQAAMTTQSDPESGYLVPSEMEQTIDRILAATVAMRRLAQVRRISAADYKKLVNVGGTSSGWVGETSSRTETDNPKLRELKFTPGEIYAMPVATQTLLDDAMIDIGEWLAGEVDIEFTEQEGAAFINGDGVEKPRGILDYPTAQNSSSLAFGKLGFVKTGAAADFAASDPLDTFMDLVYALKSGYRQNASWLMNDLIAGRVRKFKDADGNYLWQPSVQAGEPSLLLGYPVATDDNMPDVASNAFPVAFGDFRRGYLIVDRIGIRVLRDPYTNKPHVNFYTTKRVGGGVQNYEAIKLMKCAT